MTLENDLNSYYDEVNHLLSTKCGIGIQDTSTELVDSCYSNQESAYECFEQLIHKYDLTTL
ncbi:conserved hypothetical protein [Vibrio jasicida]|uniref:Uncharacterized protein n=1 Tax=Vibrio jasicida TaxID=766224 RepID=A0AAU9QTE3_9VIBR|nr:conserved hypothetical protein [Vibrio jasicida]CAH1601643.1 conserved hypothetical protein [Vibrio jasicida]